MSYFDEYEDEEYENEEVESIAESTNVTKHKDRIVIDVDMQIFAEGIVAAVTDKVKKELYEQIIIEIRNEIVPDIKETVKTSVGEIVKDIILDFMENEVIKIGGDYWGNIPAEELSLIQYAKRCIKESIENQKFKVITSIEKNNSSRGEKYKVRTEEFGFSEYLRSQLALGNDIKEYMDREIREVKDQVNKDMKNLFDKSTKEMLSQSVLNVLMANETYSKIRNQIGQIADRSID